MCPVSRRLSFWAVCAIPGWWCSLGCDQKNQYVPPPPPEVTVAQPVQQTVTDWVEATGTTEATESVELRARVEGWLEKVHFKPGTPVKEGELLFSIDDEPYQAAVARAEADLETAKAKLELAEFNFQRMAKLEEKKVAAELETVEAKANRSAAMAAVAAAEAAVESAKLDLGYTKIHAPISGRISRNLVDEGNLVGAGERTLLTTIVKDDPLYCYFNISESLVLDVLKMDRTKKVRSAKEAGGVLYLGVGDGEGYPHKGRFDWADNQVDPGTGTLRVRGVFPNPDGALMPGLFARVRAPRDQRENALLVTERALGADQQGRYLLVVNADEVVEHRSVTVGASVDGLRVIEEGLRPGEWVVINGLQRARPGAKVNPTRADMPRRKPAGTLPTGTQPTTTQAQATRPVS